MNSTQDQRDILDNSATGSSSYSKQTYFSRKQHKLSMKLSVTLYSACIGFATIVANTLVNQSDSRIAERLDPLLISYPGISGAVDAVSMTGPFILGGYRPIKRDVGTNIFAVSSREGMKGSAN